MVWEQAPLLYMIRWFPEVWETVSDAELQSMYYKSGSDLARDVERALLRHPDFKVYPDFQVALVQEMAWRWMEAQPALQFIVSSQDPDSCM